MKNLKFITKKDILNKSKQHVFNYWGYEELKGIDYENSSHRLKENNEGERRHSEYMRKQFNIWKEKQIVIFKEPKFALIYNHDTHELIIRIIEGEYPFANKFKFGGEWRDMPKDYVYYNYIGFFNSEEECKNEKEKIQKILLENEDYFLWKKYREDSWKKYEELEEKKKEIHKKYLKMLRSIENEEKEEKEKIQKERTILDSKSKEHKNKFINNKEQEFLKELKIN